MTDFYDRLAADWIVLAGLLRDHPLLWVPVLVCIWAFWDRVSPLIVWLCAWALYVVAGFFALIVGWRERHHTRATRTE